MIAARPTNLCEEKIAQATIQKAQPTSPGCVRTARGPGVGQQQNKLRIQAQHDSVGLKGLDDIRIGAGAVSESAWTKALNDACGNTPHRTARTTGAGLPVAIRSGDLTLQASSPGSGPRPGAERYKPIGPLRWAGTQLARCSPGITGPERAAPRPAACTANGQERWRWWSRDPARIRGATRPGGTAHGRGVTRSGGEDEGVGRRRRCRAAADSRPQAAAQTRYPRSISKA